MGVANHEGSRLRFPATGFVFDNITYTTDMQNKNGTIHNNVIGQDIPDIAYQSATISSRTNNRAISAIGYRGVAGIVDLIGTVEASLEGILSYGSGVYTHQATPTAASGLLQKTLYDFISQWGGIVIDTKGEDTGDLGKAVCAYGLFLTSITYNFQQNTEVTTTWNFVGYNCKWASSDFSYATDLIIGTGTELNPLSSKDCAIEVIFPGINTATTSIGVQSVSITANLNREEIYALGSLAPIDRPVTYPFEVTANLEVLADTSPLINKYTPDYKWNNAADRTSPNKIQVYVYKKSNPDQVSAFVPANDAEAKICGCPYQRPVDGSMRIGVGANSTTTLNTTGWHFEL